MWLKVWFRTGVILAPLLAATLPANVRAAVGKTDGAPSVSPAGSAQYTVPLWFPTGTGGLTPGLSLAYDHRSGNGTTGTGWFVAGFSTISRCLRNLSQDTAAGDIALTADDRFCLDGKRLRLAGGTYGAAGSEYRTEFDIAARITAYGTAGQGPASFVVETKEGERRTYGGTSDSIIEVVGSSSARVWALSKIADRSGNAIEFSYAEDSTGAYRPSQIRYSVNNVTTAGQYVVQFNYIDRPDVITGFESGPSGSSIGGQIIENKLLDNIKVLPGDGSSSIRQYLFTYESGAGGRRRMASIQECAASTSDCLSATALQWQNGTAGFGSESVSSYAVGAAPYVMDVNGDGCDDLVYSNGSTWQILFGGISGYGSATSTSIPAGTAEEVAKALPLEWNGDGKEDLLIADADGFWKVLVSNGAGFNSPVSVSSAGIAHTGTFWFTVADVNGDGRDDLIRASNISNPSVRYGELFVALRQDDGYFGPLVIRWSGLGDYEIRFHSTATDKPFGPSSHLSNNSRRRVDLNGDGREDFVARVCNTISLTTCPAGYEWYGFLGTDGDFTAPLHLILLGATNNATRMWFGRFNVDTYTDAVYVDDTGLVYVSLGRGIGSTAVGGVSTAGYDTSRLVVLDYDADGYDDIMLPNGANTWCVIRSNGQGLDAPACNGPTAAAARPVVADVNGDGLSDLAYADSSTNVWRFHAHNGVKADLLQSVTDGFGNRAAFSYLPMSNPAVYNPVAYKTGMQVVAYPVMNYQGSDPLVRTLTITPAGLNPYSFSYSYGTSRVDLHGRGSLGFLDRTIIDNRNGIKTVYSHHQTVPYIGAVANETVLQSSGTIISSVSHGYGNYLLDSTAGNKRYLPYLSSSTVSSYEVGGAYNGVLVATVSTADTVDEYGTVTNHVVTTTENNTGLSTGSTHTQRTWHESVVNDTTYWCLGRPHLTRQINSHSQAGGVSVTRTLERQWNTPACRPTHEIIEPGNSTWQVTTALGYDSFGNITSITQTPLNGQGSRTTAISWGETGQRPLTVTNALDQKTNLTWNSALGLREGVTDPNGLTTKTLYDSFGRVSRVERPDGAATDYIINSCNADNGYCGTADLRAYQDIITRNTSNAAIRTDKEYVDGLNRGRYTYTQGLDGSYSYVRTTYDALGRVATQNVPYTGSGTDYVTTISYDLIGRTTSIRRPISAADSTEHETTFKYEGLKVTQTDALGRSSAQYLSAIGQTVQAIDAAGSDTDYEYDAFGNLVKMRDVQGTETILEYNVRGMRIASKDPDMGNWTYDFYPLGELKSQTDANSKTTIFTYDPLSRPLTREEFEGTTNWVWGNEAANFNIGSLLSVASPGFTESYLYDNRGRPSRRRIVSDATYDYNFTYDSSTGLPETLAYPTSTSSYRLTLEYGYQYGLLNQVKDADSSTVFWHADAMNARGQTTRETFGNGVVTQRAVDAVTGLVSSIQSGIGGAAALQNESYLFDRMDNLSQRQNNNLGLTENFYYDNLYRLDYSTLGGTTNLDMAYDAIGNITGRSDVAGGATWTYHPTKKHAVTQAGNGSFTYSYDANGNAITRNGYEIKWTASNYPREINGPAKKLTFSYGPDRQRFRQVYDNGSMNETTEYVGGLLEKVTVGSAVDWRHYIAANGQVVAIMSRKSSGANATRYVLEDYQQGVAQIVEANGAPYVSESFAAFGARRDASDWAGDCGCADLVKMSEVSRRGYTGHEMIGGASMGLIHMNGRVQDSITGRFLSADPYIQAPYFSQSLNRYSYTFNNPMSYTDPSGFINNDSPDSALFDDFWYSVAAEEDWNLYGGNSRIRPRSGAQSNIWATGLAVAGAPIRPIDSTVGGAGQLAVNDYVTLLGSGYYERVGIDIGQGMTLMVPTRIYASSDPTAAAGLQRAEEVLGVIAAGTLIVIPGPEDLVIAGGLAARGITTVIGRTKDLKNLAVGERSLLDRLTPNLGSPKANWQRNAGVLRQEMRRGLPIRDASPGDTGGVFLNAERALLMDRGWSFNPQTGYWMPPGL